jgi:hypothetical protein
MASTDQSATTSIRTGASTRTSDDRGRRLADARTERMVGASDVDSSSAYSTSSSSSSADEGDRRKGRKASQNLSVTTPFEMIPYYCQNHSIWSLINNKESTRWVLPG